MLEAHGSCDIFEMGLPYGDIHERIRYTPPRAGPVPSRPALNVGPWET